MSADDAMRRSEPPVWIDILAAPQRQPLDEAAFVLTAVGIDSHLVHEPSDQWRLFVPQEMARQANQQLEAYRRENRDVPTPATPFVPIDSGWVGVLIFLLVIWVLPTLESRSVFGWQWHEIGVMHAGAVMSGEWWRTITALTLHADLPHLLGNSLFGAVFGLLVGRQLGSGLGWLLVLLCAALGNGFNAALQADDFRSIGASTANFAALGLGGAVSWGRGYYLPAHNTGRWRRAFAPVFAAIALLAYTGTGGVNTDIVAHFTGFLSGLAMGLVVARFDIRRLGQNAQVAAGAIALSLVIAAWVLAGSD